MLYNYMLYHHVEYYDVGVTWMGFFVLIIVLSIVYCVFNSVKTRMILVEPPEGVERGIYNEIRF
jgi:hypothetical protein